MNSISKRINNTNKSKSLYSVSKYFGGNIIDSAVSGLYKKAPKIKDLIVWVNLIGSEGAIRRLPSLPNDILHEVISRHYTDNFYPKCNGNHVEIRKISDDVVSNLARGPSCGFCHVTVEDPWFSYMKKNISQIESDVLVSTNEIVYPTSRLACGVKIKPWMNEMIVKVIGNPLFNEDYEGHNPGGFGANGSGPSAMTNI